MKHASPRRIRALIALSAGIVMGAQAQAGSATDAWDVSQGSVVTQFTPNPALANNGPGMFGGDAGASSPFAVERFNTIFPDLLPVDTVHSIEWTTPSAISLIGWQLQAYGDGNGGRQFSHLTLSIDSGGSWVAISSLNTSSYDPVTHELNLGASFAAVTASHFRAEFTQATALFGQSGPRIVEFDAVTTPVPEPGAWLLMLGGLAGLLARRATSPRPGQA